MHRNILVKSTLRQPIRTAVLMLLIAVAAFAFATRGLEYIAVSNRISDIGSYYRTIGVLQDKSGNMTSVSAGADIIGKSPHVSFEDRRRAAAGLLQGIRNADTSGIGDNYANRYIQSGLPLRYIPDAFFYAELIKKEYIPGSNAHIIMHLLVDSVEAGYPEHLEEGREVSVYYFPSEQEKDAISQSLQHQREQGELLPTGIDIDGMAVGERYFLRAFLYANAMTSIGYSNVLAFRPINESTSDYIRKMPSEELWYVPCEAGQRLDLDEQQMRPMREEIDRANRSQHEMQLRTSADMTYYPYAQGDDRTMFLQRGRFFDRNDYLNANPVAVVNEYFAQARGLDIGDSITVSVQKNHSAVDSVSLSIGTFGQGVNRAYSFFEFGISAPVQETNSRDIELEIVGTYHLFPTDSATGDLSQNVYDDISLVANFVYIPDSVLPPDIELTFPDYGPFAQYSNENDPLPDVWYSFALNDPGDKDAFLLECRGVLDAMGYDIALIEIGDAENFRITAQPLLQAVLFNAVTFAVALVALLALVAFLFLRQRRRDFAIMRILGRPQKNAARQLYGAMALVGLPAMIAGGAAGWFFALGKAMDTMEPLRDLGAEMGLTIEVSAPLIWLPAMIAAAFVILSALFAVFTRKTTRRSVLGLLQ